MSKLAVAIIYHLKILLNRFNLNYEQDYNKVQAVVSGYQNKL